MSPSSPRLPRSPLPGMAGGPSQAPRKPKSTLVPPAEHTPYLTHFSAWSSASLFSQEGHMGGVLSIFENIFQCPQM